MITITKAPKFPVTLEQLLAALELQGYDTGDLEGTECVVFAGTYEDRLDVYYFPYLEVDTDKPAIGEIYVYASPDGIIEAHFSDYPDVYYFPYLEVDTDKPAIGEIYVDASPDGIIEAHFSDYPPEGIK